jgi:integrase
MGKRPEQVELENDLIERLLNAPDKRSLQGRRDVAIMRFALETGLRVSEICGLKIGNLVRQDQHYSIVVRSAKKRREESREIPLTNGMVGWIQSYWMLEYGSRTPAVDQPFFRNLGKHGRCRKVALTPKAMRLVIERCKASADVEARITPHTFRHTLLSRIARTRDVETARQLAGHSSLSSTQRYLHSTQRRKRDAIEGLDYGV